jgi:hypothetical protein
MAGPIKFVISIINNAVVVTSDDGKTGGNIRTRMLRRVVWERDTTAPGKVDRFDLKFERLGDVDGAVAAGPDWPLFEVRAQPGSAAIDEDAGTVSGAMRFAGRLAEPGIYKYSVVAYSGSTSVALDPVIIIEN